MPAFSTPPERGVPASQRFPNLYGTGVAFPIQTAPTGGLQTASGEDLVRQAVREFLTTDLGEGIRAFDVKDGVPYGTRLRRYQFESIDVYRDLASYEVARGLGAWEPRIRVSKVDVVAPVDWGDPVGRRTVLVTPHYTLVTTGRPDNATVPFLLKVVA